MRAKAPRTVVLLARAAVESENRVHRMSHPFARIPSFTPAYLSCHGVLLYRSMAVVGGDADREREGMMMKRLLL